MFTGIIEEIGKITQIDRGVSSVSLTIAGEVIFSDLSLGDSVAVNGICLTARQITATTFTADVMPETIKATALSTLTPGSAVNLERALPAAGRFGGHIVTGHVDGIGRIQATKKDDNAILVTVSAPADIMRYVLHKGSIAIDGISLTVQALSSNDFSVSIIPHTKEITTLLTKKPGDLVNLEADIIGKYVERLISPHKPTGITADFLAEHGF